MTSPDDRLSALFAEETPPARDRRFEAEVFVAVAKRRFMADLVVMSSIATTGACILWLLWPVVGPALNAFGQSLAPAGMALALAATVLVFTSGRAWAARP